MKVRVIAKEYVVNGIVLNTNYDSEFGTWTASASFWATQGGLGLSEEDSDKPAIASLRDDLLAFLHHPDFPLGVKSESLAASSKAKREEWIEAFAKRIQNYGDDRVSCELPYSRGVPEDPRHIAIALLNDIFPPF